MTAANTAANGVRRRNRTLAEGALGFQKPEGVYGIPLCPKRWAH